MSKKRKVSTSAKQPDAGKEPVVRRGRLWWLPSAVLVVGAVLVAVFAVNVFFEPSGSGDISGGNTKASGATKPVGEDRAKPLIGRWLRPDGGYELKVESVANDGKVTASYLNPRPIRISRPSW